MYAPGGGTPDGAEAWRAGHQAATLLRISHAAANLLLRLQAARVRREATPESANSAALTEHCVLQSMAQALEARAEADSEAPSGAVAAQAASEAQQALPPPPGPDPAPVTAEHMAAAEAYAQSSPTNANRGRILRRKAAVPNWAMFTPPASEIVNTLARGHSPFLDALLPAPAAYWSMQPAQRRPSKRSRGSPQPRQSKRSS